MSGEHASPSGWQLEEGAPEAYERYLVPRMFTPGAKRLLDRTDVGPDDRVLDVGCGTGVVARLAAERVGDAGTVVGVDVNDGMLAVARRAASEAGHSVEWRRGEATSLPVPDEAFDAVCCQHVLQFVADPAAVLRELRRVVRPDGRVGVSVWRPIVHNPAYVELAETLDGFAGEAAGATMRSPFSTWDRDDLRSLATTAAFADATVSIEIDVMRYPSVVEFVRREAASSPLSESLAALDESTRTELVEDARDRLRSHTDDDGVVFPMESWLLSATK